MSQAAWWKGRRGEWYVIGQVALALLVFFGPRTGAGWPEWSPMTSRLGLPVGGAFLAAGISLLAASIIRLGAGLTPLPYPKEQATLVETGPYRLVRHPMYCAGILIAFGWALWVHGWLTLGFAIVLLAFFDIKARREEQWLNGKFSGYVAYQKRVRKLIPFVY